MEIITAFLIYLHFPQSFVYNWRFKFFSIASAIINFMFIEVV